MEHLTEVTVDDLQSALESVTEKKPTQRLIVAIAYKNGITQSELAAWFDVERKTIYNWLTRLETRDLDSAVRDEHRAGRPRKLSDEQLAQLETTLRDPPTEAGVDAPAWTTDLLQAFVRDRFDVEYSRPSCRRLMKEAGLSCRNPHEAAAEIDAEDREELTQELNRLGHVWMPS